MKAQIPKKRKQMYLVMAHQYSCRQGHIYPVGVYFTKESAMHNAKWEYRSRMGKYGIVVYETRHPNKHNPERLNKIFELESPYKGKLKSFTQTKA